METYIGCWSNDLSFEGSNLFDLSYYYSDFLFIVKKNLIAHLFFDSIDVQMETYNRLLIEHLSFEVSNVFDLSDYYSDFLFIVKK